MKMKITILNFSGRKEGNCSNVTRVLENEFKEQEVNIINFNEVNIFSCSNCNYECFKENDQCPYIIDDILDIYNKIIGSDLVYYIIPNYCGYPCSNFFVFNERGCSFFSGNKELLDKYLNINKKFIVISNSSEENFKNVLMYHTTMNPDILFLSTKKYNQKSIDGTLMDDDQAKQEVIQFTQYMFA